MGECRFVSQVFDICVCQYNFELSICIQSAFVTFPCLSIQQILLPIYQNSNLPNRTDNIINPITTSSTFIVIDFPSFTCIIGLSHILAPGMIFSCTCIFFQLNHLHKSSEQQLKQICCLSMILHTEIH